ncbi:MAG: diadenylate cyclase CdaA [Methylacidiphilales bacterium]|nr:diadenylate cyclase CdaA [Candidatus Methylacidiphilales bacterium]MDW8349299.1 diadenylate cyclase CdaA [Verrucomicrobiae bacterium]
MFTLTWLLFSWLIEVTLMAAAIYHSWKLLRGTRGARVLAGLVLVMVVALAVTQILQLKVISYLILKISGFFFIALVVIFQPEVRQLLADLGSKSTRIASRVQTEVIEAVVSAIEILQQEKLGALIAFERAVSYAPGRETGTVLDAKVSTDLIVTLFHNRTPLHDGGVIIKDDRIVVAAAIFPVSEDNSLSRTCGLRHRAALGLSEQTDAIVVILSEESGTIAVAHGGKLIQPLTSDELRSYLTEKLI